MIGELDHTSVVAENRIGVFRVGMDLLRHISDAEIKSLFDGFLIVKAEPQFVGDVIEYTAYHREFGVVPDAAQIPRYILKFTLDNGVLVRTEIKG